MITVQDMGNSCRKFRKEHGYRLWHVARDTGYSIENISAFECGKNDNGLILLWYVRHGMTAVYFEV